jgi:hypothetical protein
VSDFNALDMLRTVVGMAHGQGPLSNVADLVWLGPEAMRELDSEVRTLSEVAPADAVPTFEHAAYVLPDGALLLALFTDRGGFCFRAEPGGWGWVARPA